MKLRFFLLSLSSLLLTLVLCDCKKEPEVITEEITVHDTTTVVETDTIIITHVDTLTLEHIISDTLTTFILVRHAETTGSGTNPGLDSAGLRRVDALIDALTNVNLSAVYSTDYQRTQQTANPVASDHSLTVTNYDPSALPSFADQAMTLHQGETVLVVGHSNTTPDLLNELTLTSDYTMIPEAEYDHLYIVTVPLMGDAVVQQMRYGE